MAKNLASRFRCTGLYPRNVKEPIRRHPAERRDGEVVISRQLDKVLIDCLREHRRQDKETSKPKRGSLHSGGKTYRHSIYTIDVIFFTMKTNLFCPKFQYCHLALSLQYNKMHLIHCKYVFRYVHNVIQACHFPSHHYFLLYRSPHKKFRTEQTVLHKGHICVTKDQSLRQTIYPSEKHSTTLCSRETTRNTTNKNVQSQSEKTSLSY